MFLKGKSAIVTGSTSGIGLAYAKALAAAGQDEEALAQYQKAEAILNESGKLPSYLSDLSAEIARLSKPADQ